MWIKNRQLQVLADQAVFSGTSFLLTILIARYMDISDFGIYSAYILLIYLAVSAISSWTTQVYQVATEKTHDYIGFIFWFQVLLSVLSVGTVCLVGVFIGFETSYSVFLFGFGFVMYDFGRKLFLADAKISHVLLLDVLTSVLMILAFFYYTFQDIKVLNNLFLYFGNVYMISLAVIVFILKPFHFDTFHFRTYMRHHIIEGKWLFFTSVSQWWAGNLFVVASGLYIGAAALGALRLSQSLLGVLNVLLQSFENYVLPQSDQKMNIDMNMGVSYLKEMNKKLAFVFIPVLVLLFVMASPILMLTGGTEYTEYTYVLQGLCILYVFILLSQPIRFMIRAMHLNQYFFIGYLFSLAYAIITSHELISSFGLVGVVTGLIGAQIILIVYWLFILQSKKQDLWKSCISF